MRNLSMASLLVAVALALVALSSLLVTEDDAVRANSFDNGVRQAGESEGEIDMFSMSPSVDQEAAFPNEEKRRVLALYDSTETIAIDEEDDDKNAEPEVLVVDQEYANAHRFLELPLNHLGLVLEFQDVNAPWPSDEEMASYRGVVAWFRDDRMKDPARFATWIADQIDSGQRIVFVERFGMLKNLEGADVDAKDLAPFFKAAGVEYLGGKTYDGSLISVQNLDEKMMGHELPMPSIMPFYDGIKAPASASVHLKLGRTDRKGVQSDAVFTAPFGGFILYGYAISESRLGERWVRRWLVDPYRFFTEVFDLEDLPKPDFTTQNGIRLFYAHVDGDGLEMLSEIDNRKRCADLLRERVFEHYTFPWTASVVVGLTAPPPLGVGTKKDAEAARKIFALDNIEAASHGLAHPMNWRAGELAELSVEGLPDYELSGETEVRQSVEYVDRFLLPAGKKTKVMLWTGWTNPNSEQLQVAYDMGLRNMNGGDGRMDSHYPSASHLAPAIHRVGDLFQFFSSAANDYILTDQWTPPYYRYQNVIETFQLSGRRHRIIPINVYVHFYITRNQAALTGLERVMDWVRGQEVYALFVSEYVDIVRDFHWSRIGRQGNAWVARVGSHLRTLRFDRANAHVDIEKSEGVIGYLQMPSLGVTYVHLDADEVKVVLSDRKPRAPFLSKASHLVKNAKIGFDKIEFDSKGFGPARYVFSGFDPGASYRVNALSDQGEIEARVAVKSDGRLIISTDTMLAGTKIVVTK